MSREFCMYCSAEIDPDGPFWSHTENGPPETYWYCVPCRSVAREEADGHNDIYHRAIAGFEEREKH